MAALLSKFFYFIPQFLCEIAVEFHKKFLLFGCPGVVDRVFDLDDFVDGVFHSFAAFFGKEDHGVAAFSRGKVDEVFLLHLADC